LFERGGADIHVCEGPSFEGARPWIISSVSGGAISGLRFGFFRRAGGAARGAPGRAGPQRELVCHFSPHHLGAGRSISEQPFQIITTAKKTTDVLTSGGGNRGRGEPISGAKAAPRPTANTTGGGTPRIGNLSDEKTFFFRGGDRGGLLGGGGLFEPRPARHPTTFFFFR